MRTFILFFVAAGFALAADTNGPRRAAPPAAGGEKVAAPADEEIRDVLLMLDESPLHLRFHLTLSGTSLSGARGAYVERLMKSLDTDGDGKLSAEEAARSPLLTTNRRGAAAAFLDSIDGKKHVTRKELMQSVERVGGEVVVYRQDVSASKNDSEVFKLLDADGSGYLDASEMAAAAARILERDQDQDECITFQEFLPEPDPDQQAALVIQRPGQNPAPTATIADLLKDISEPLLPVRLLKKYDRNRDRKLTAEELGWEPERVKLLDRNSDGKLDQKELSAIATTPVDLDLLIDLAGSAEGESALSILATSGTRLDDSRRPDLMRLVFSKAILTFSFRKIDPIKTAIEKAMQAFNQLDTDNNGYLDEKETAQLIRFQRGLFEALDADSDGKIFGEEMEKYVAVRGEPAATTARVNVYDIGRGFFESLDCNADGRISMREMKGAEKSLQGLARRTPQKLSPEDPARNFHIEFMRGSFVLFGPGDQMTTQATPSFEQRVAIGPIWFQRMDRNNDGDLTWNEFLGPREVFHRIDADGDGLIDPQEAEAFKDE